MKHRVTFAAALLVSLSLPLQAQDRPVHHEPGRGHAPTPHEPSLHLDQRYHHDHYYPPHGQVVGALPSGSISIGVRGGNYFFHGGVWFRPWGGRFVVTLPPLGIVVPSLPPAVATLWIGGVPYYYANGVYYAVAPGQGFVVVAPPPGADTAQPVMTAPQGIAAPIVYPRDGQSTAQTAADRQQCDTWASAQPGSASDAQVFQRALAACLDGRGYTVR